jgi:hypothetical protein
MEAVAQHLKAKAAGGSKTEGNHGDPEAVVLL